MCALLSPVTVAAVLFIAGLALWLCLERRRPRFNVIACLLTADDNVISISFRLRARNSTSSGSLPAGGPRVAYAVDEATGAVLPVLSLPRLGRMLAGGRRGNDYCYMMVANQGRVVKRGSKITVVVGSHKQEGLTVH